MFTMAWKIYGENGRKQRESFSPSVRYDWSTDDDIRILEMLNSDKTGTNEYSIFRITKNTKKDCLEELRGQLSDGWFEGVPYGKVEEISLGCCPDVVVNTKV